MVKGSESADSVFMVDVKRNNSGTAVVDTSYDGKVTSYKPPLHVAPPYREFPR